MFFEYSNLNLSNWLSFSYDSPNAIIPDAQQQFYVTDDLT